MAQIVYIGDEATAAGFRLAGLDARVAGPGDAAEFLRQAAREDNDCVLLSGLLAEFIRPPRCPASGWRPQPRRTGRAPGTARRSRR
jgi:vacuolar-type H+-ATPase subunit F/Vma7